MYPLGTKTYYITLVKLSNWGNLTLMQYYYLSYSPHSIFAHFPTMSFTAIFLSIQDLGLYNAFSCQVSLFSFNLEPLSAFTFLFLFLFSLHFFFFFFFSFQSFLTLPFLESIGLLFCRRSLSLGLMFPRDSGYAFLAGLAHKWCCPSRCITSIFPITDDVHFNHLVQVVSARFLHCKTTILLFVFNNSIWCF